MFGNKYNCVRQMDTTDCAAACLATIFQYYSLEVSLAKIREAAKTDRNGTTIYGIRKAAEKYNFDVVAVTSKGLDKIKSDFPKPAIAHVVFKDGMTHFVVIHDVIKDKVIVADPNEGIVSYKIKEFTKIWDGKLVFLKPNDKFVPTKNRNKTIELVFNMLWNNKKYLILIFIISLFINISGIVGAIYYKLIIDSVIPKNNIYILEKISIAVIIVMIFKSIYEVVRTRLTLSLGKRIDISILLKYYYHVIDLPMEFFSNRKVGEIMSRFNDAYKIREAISSATLTVMMDVMMTIVSGIILFKLSHSMFYLCFIPIIIYLITLIAYDKKILKKNEKIMEANSKLESFFVESMQGIETIKAYNAEDKAKKETSDKFNAFLNESLEYGIISNNQIFIKNLVKGIFGICILWVGSYLTIKNDITIGTFVAFNSLLAYFMEPIERVMNLQNQIKSALVAAKRLLEIIELNIEKNVNSSSIKTFNSLKGNIELRNVKFRYGSNNLLFNKLNMSIESGKKVAIVGESGSGKTTIAKLLMKFYKYEEGEITINSLDVKNMDIELLRNKIAYISQESFFFSASIKENLRLSNKDITENEMIDICKKVKIHDYINSLPDRYDTVLSENASNLSGGQKQRLAIARALLKKPEILIMDEATSSLDTITEKAIQDTIENCTNNITTIIIAHRLGTIKKCDRIYVLDKGSVVEEGTHEQLINSRGYYYLLWNEQSI